MENSKHKQQEEPLDTRRNNQNQDTSTDKAGKLNNQESKNNKQKFPIDVDVQEGNIKHDPSDPHGLKTEIERHDRQE